MNLLIKFFLKLKFGNAIRLGKGCKFFDIPDFDIKGSGNVYIGEDVIVKRRCDIRAYDGSSVIIGSRSKIDDNVRIIAANGNDVNLKENVKIGYCSVLNGGGGIVIGKNSSTYGNVYIQSSSHTIKNSVFSKNHYQHKQVIIGSHCLISPFNKIAPGQVIEDGSII